MLEIGEPISRRDVLKFAVVGVIFSQLPGTIWAYHASADKAWWGSYDWWPLKDGIVNDAGVLMHTLHEAEGPLHQHDVDTGRFARQWAEDLARRVLSELPL